MTEAKRKPFDEDPKKPGGDSSETDTSDTRAGGDVVTKGPSVKDNPPSYDDESMPIDPPDNTGGGGW